MNEQQMQTLQAASKLPAWFVAVPIAFLIGGFVAMWLALRYRKLAAACQSWPTATGTVVANAIRTSESSNDSSKSFSNYTPAIEYEYLVAGQSYRGSRIKFGGVGSSTSLAKAQAKADRYPLGSEVPVFYDPAKPSQCTLDQTISSLGVAMLFVFGVIFVVVSLGGFAMLAIMHGGN